MEGFQEKKVVVISGGAGYVGGAIAKQLESEGFTVAVLYRGERPNVPHAYKCDISAADAVSATVDIIERELGPLYACIHAAGSMPLQKLLYLVTPEEFDTEMKGQAGSAFIFLSDAARRLKLQKSGVLIGITTASVATTVNTKARGIYSPSKFALQGILTAFKEELAPFGVRVYSVAPGVMAVGLNKKTPKAFLDIVREKIPNKTLITAEDVAAQVAYLCSDAASGEKHMTFLLAPESTSDF